MKKILLALAVFAAAASFASAGVNISWAVAYAAYDHTATDLLGGEDPLLNYSVTWQLIYAGANNTADDLSLATGGGNGDYVTGDDVVWASRIMSASIGNANVIDSNGTEWTPFLEWTSGSAVYQDGDWSTAGYVYQRVFEGTPAALSWYFESPLHALNTSWDSGGGPGDVDSFNLGSGSLGIQPDQQVPAVPEPATMSLLGLGALVMAIRRRRS